MRVRIYHSTDERFIFRAWTPEAPLRLVDDYHLMRGEGQYPAPGSGEKVVALMMAEPLDEYMNLATGKLPERLLENIYRHQNAVDGWERNVKLRLRSLSVGDVVMLNDRAFAVESAGFVEIAVDQMKVEVRSR